MKKLHLLLALLTTCLSPLFISCNDDPEIVPSPGEDPTPSVKETVVTGEARNVTALSAVLEMDVDLSSNPTEYEGGIYYCQVQDGGEYSEEGAFLVQIPYAKDGPERRSHYALSVDYLQPNTTYAYCAWVRMDGQVYHGQVRHFATPELVVDAGPLVDMGVSVLWAAWNVGATSPTQPGNFYAWGETAPKEIYDVYTYDSQLSTKYNGIEHTRLLPEDDAATVNWGPGYRMPTMREKRELLRNTDRRVFTYQGVRGYLFISRINGHMLFFPFTGMQIGGTVGRANDLVGVWTSDLYQPESSADFSQAYIMCNIISGGGLLEQAGFDMDQNSDNYNLHQLRTYGASVRPVCAK